MSSPKSLNRFVECICPKCGKIHKRYMFWTGTTKPRYFCKAHEKLAGNALEHEPHGQPYGRVPPAKAQV